MLDIFLEIAIGNQVITKINQTNRFKFNNPLYAIYPGTVCPFCTECPECHSKNFSIKKDAENQIYFECENEHRIYAPQNLERMRSSTRCQCHNESCNHKVTVNFKRLEHNEKYSSIREMPWPVETKEKTLNDAEIYSSEQYSAYMDVNPNPQMPDDCSDDFIGDWVPSEVPF